MEVILKFVSKRPLHDPVQVLVRRSCGDPSDMQHDLVQVPVRSRTGPCVKILALRS